MQHLLLDEVQSFIRGYSGKNPSELALKRNPFPDIPIVDLIIQIESRLKCKSKLPTWYATQGILYPQKISIEQSSSERAAAYKASLVTGNSIIDLTGGFGVDAYYFKSKFKQVVHCELNPELSKIVAQNYKTLGIDIECICGDGLDILTTKNKRFDVIYIDPSRRHQSKGKVFHLEDYEPDIIHSMPTYLNYSDTILIKVSPLLDIQYVLQSIPFVKEIHLVAVQNEVKEFLILVQKDFRSSVTVTAVNLLPNVEEIFTFDWNQEKLLQTQNFSLPLTYLYEPNAAIMKSSGFGSLTQAFPVSKLHPNSHLFTSEELQPFPGRTFKIKDCFLYQKNNLRDVLKDAKANITVRNFPETVESLKKKWKISDGGNQYLFFTTNLENHKIVLLCEKIF